jgi:hypothetical protein
MSQAELVEERDGAWRAGCSICHSLPTRWKIELPEPDSRGRIASYFCERHQANRDMLVAQLTCTQDDPLATNV